MKIIVLFDSQFGNTKKIAEAIIFGCGKNDVRLYSTTNMNMSKLSDIDLFIVGSPTYGGRAKQELQTVLDQIPELGLKGIRVAAFDTRFLEQEQNFALRLLMKTIGYAAPKIALFLEQKGGKLITTPEGFIVQGRQGPLRDGELVRAKAWGKMLAS